MTNSELRMDIKPDFKSIYEFAIRNLESSIGFFHKLWANSDQAPFLLGQFNFFEVFDICFSRTRRVFEIRQPGAAEFAVKNQWPKVCDLQLCGIRNGEQARGGSARTQRNREALDPARFVAPHFSQFSVTPVRI